MSWTVVVPVKPPADRKRRLHDLTPGERIDLTERMLSHVLAVAAGHPDVAEVVLVSAEARPGFGWLRDQGRGLNGELEAARAALSGRDVLALHADLPLLAADDLTALFSAAERAGAAIAPDRLGTGTNAAALKAGAPFVFRFGEDSRARHAAQLADPVAVVERPGLSHDVDTPDDLAAVRALSDRA